ncbi:TPA: hypothetical protein DDZ10_04655, partial [Candidatus Uhrbacteria bacterium]|nr:hypothetical protein [Candidatus Uhrbacteria bacterium]
MEKNHNEHGNGEPAKGTAVGTQVDDREEHEHEAQNLARADCGDIRRHKVYERRREKHDQEKRKRNVKRRSWLFPCSQTLPKCRRNDKIEEHFRRKPNEKKQLLRNPFDEEGLQWKVQSQKS